MKIVSYTMVNNEAEIIESFIRYNSCFVDEMFIIDNGCTDNTISILNKLIEEGYKLTVFDESLEAYNQFRLDNKYLSVVNEICHPDIIIPLDADEFIIADGNPREQLEKLSTDSIYYINWQWYVMTSEDTNDDFIPLRMQYHLDRVPWNYSDGTPVTKVILPAKYYFNNKLTMSMGHHTVYGNNNVNIEKISQLRLAHYRSISTEQLVSKTACYTVRDISTLENNFETAQRTNQMFLIECGTDMKDAATTSSYGGYECGVIHDPIPLEYCDKDLTIKYSSLSSVPLWKLTRNTGCEMAIKYYNVERKIRERHFLKPIVLWMDGKKGMECVFPDPSNKSTLMVARANVRAYLTDTEEIKFLKANYRLIVTTEWLKFIPFEYIVVPSEDDVDKVINVLGKGNINANKVVTWSEYIKRIGLLKRIWLEIGIVPGAVERVLAYMKRNGLKNTKNKLLERIKRGN